MGNRIVCISTRQSRSAGCPWQDAWSVQLLKTVGESDDSKNRTLCLSDNIDRGYSPLETVTELAYFKIKHVTNFLFFRGFTSREKCIKCPAGTAIAFIVRLGRDLSSDQLALRPASVNIHSINISDQPEAGDRTCVTVCEP
jgi:hypothetical protein